mgnify:FL=1
MKIFTYLTTNYPTFQSDKLCTITRDKGCLQMYNILKNNGYNVVKTYQRVKIMLSIEEFIRKNLYDLFTFMVDNDWPISENVIKQTFYSAREKMASYLWNQYKGSELILRYKNNFLQYVLENDYHVNDVKIMKQFMYGKVVTFDGNNNYTLLNYAIQMHNYYGVDKLLTYSTKKSLYLAISSNNIIILKLVLKAYPIKEKVSDYDFDYKNDRVMKIASKTNNIEIIKLLCENGYKLITKIYWVAKNRKQPNLDIIEYCIKSSQFDEYHERFNNNYITLL